jgi:hypothetical protein
VLYYISSIHPQLDWSQAYTGDYSPFERFYMEVAIRRFGVELECICDKQEVESLYDIEPCGLGSQREPERENIPN